MDGHRINKMAPHPQKSSSRPKAAHFAAAVERPPHFVFAFAYFCIIKFALIQ
jgi:hypothetical protein